MKKVLSLAMSLLMIFSIFGGLDMTVMAAAFEAPDGRLLTSLKEYNIAPGITEQHIVTCDKDGSSQVKAYAAVIDLNNGTTGLMAGYKDYDTSGTWGMQTVRDQAAAAEKKTGKNIVVAMNADYFNMSSGEPNGALVMNGKIVHVATTEAWYFAILKDGTPVIRSGDTPLDDVQEAVGSPILLVKDGEIAVSYDENDTDMPRGAIGITADNKIVLYEADGRQAPSSCGETVYETAKIMLELGCVQATYLDGGGSATFTSKSEGDDTLTVKNSPSDGNERKVSSSIFVYSTAEPDGVFHHAALTPYNEVYTPGYTVEFSAVGVDSTGGKADIPAGVTYALEDESYGTIDAETGVFISNGKIGKVTVNLKNGTQIVGSTYIEIQHPDSISFINEEISMGWEEESDLNLIVKYQNRTMSFKDGDFTWGLVNDDEYLWTQEDANNGLCDADAVGTNKMSIGTFTYNTFKSCDSNTVKATATCYYKYADGEEEKTVSGSIHLIVGLQPTVVMDFEDYVDEDGNIIPAEDYWTVNNAVFSTSGGLSQLRDLNGNALDISNPTGKLIWGNYARGGKGSAEIVSAADGEPVRKGTHSLKINYDFTNITGTEGSCVGFSQVSQQIPGSPTAIGMYLYAPEGCTDLWVRARIINGNGTTDNINFADKGITWNGWRYLEASLEGLQGPFSLMAGETIRIVHVGTDNSNGAYIADEDGNKTYVNPSDRYGAVYIDNLQFVYGANSTDVDNPNVDAILANDVEVTDGSTISSNTSNFEIKVSDVENKYTSDINFDLVSVAIDGEKVDNVIADSGKSAFYIYDHYLPNGLHSMKVTIKDNEDNETIKTIYFTVDGNENLTPSISIVPGSDKALLCDYTDISIKTSDAAKTESVTATIKLGRGLTDPKINYGEAFEEYAEPVYNQYTNVLTIYASKKNDATASGEQSVATVSVLTPASFASDADFTYTVTGGKASVLTTDTAEQKNITFSTDTVKIGVYAKYKITADIMVEGFNTNIYVTDNDGNAMKNFAVYNNTDNTEIGKTNDDGILTTNAFSSSEQKVEIYAQDNDGFRSFVYKTQCYSTAANNDGSPTFVKVNATENASTSKCATWISKPGAAQKEAYIQYALKSDYKANGENSFTTVSGESEYLVFFGSSNYTENKAVYSNKAVLSGLLSDTEYVYRVGDGKLWSDVYSFRTSYDGEETNFFIVGDTQAETDSSIASVKRVVDAIVDSDVDYSFGVQTGDFVEGGAIYSDWNNILSSFNSEYLNGIDMLHVIGNHETYGVDDASIARSLFNITDEKCYSVTYGNVYLATVEYTSSDAQVQEYAKWLVEDAAKSDAQWKILISHQPYYGTNSTTTDYAPFTKYMTAACDEAGIDFAFSGHDHSYTRSFPIYNGEKNKNGTVYYICGSTGEKSYSVTKNDNYHEIATDDYNGIYLSVNATASDFTVTAYNVAANGNATVYDTYTKTKEVCKNNLHTYSCTDDGHLVCSVCGYAKRVEDYTGLVTDQTTGKLKYLKNGNFAVNNWVTIGSDAYYFGEDGFATTDATVKIDGREYTFDKYGKFVAGSFVDEEVTLANGTKKTITRYYTAGGVFETKWTLIDGDYYYFKKQSDRISYPEDGMMYKNGKYSIVTPQKNTNRTFTFDSTGKLILGAWEDELATDKSYIGTRYYWGSEYVTGTKEVQGVTYTFDSQGYVQTKDISTCDISVDPYAVYTGKAITPTVTVFDGTQLLSKGTNYTVTYEDNKELGTATVTVTGNEKRGYTGKKVLTFDILLDVPSLSAVSQGTSLVVSWNTIKCASGYELQKYNTTSKKWETVVVTASTSYAVKGLSDNTATKFRVRPYAIYGETKVYGDYSAVLTAKLNVSVPTVTNVKAVSGKKSVKVSWSAVNGAAYYNVYRYNSAKKTYEFIKKVTGTSMYDYSIAQGKTYYYKVKACIVYGGKTFMSDFSTAAKIKFASALGSVSSVSAKASSSSIKLSWSKVSGASGYVVYRYNTAKKTWKKLGTTTSRTFTDTGLKAGTNYKYSIRAIVKINGKTYKGAAKRVTFTTNPAKVTSVKTESSKAKTATLTWSKVTGASGYEVYRATSKNGTYKKVATIKKGSSVKYTNKSLKSGTTYYYKVRAYKTLDSKTYYGSFSSVRSVKVK